MGANAKILLVEDDRMISGMYETKLRQEGFQIVLAENGADALELAIQERPDLVLLDIILPQIDGFAVLQELRLNRNTREIPIVMLTNLGTPEDKEKGVRYGATEYLVKANLTPTDVAQTVKKFLTK
jgi:DNA-binding response OmpR family regulator